MVGRVLDGRYRIVDRVARGGMSTVYAAVDTRLEREIAVKVMSPALSSDPAFADRFAREARIAAKMSHPNAVAVYDQGTDADGHVYLVMELVRGRTLRDLIREHGPLSNAQAVSIMEPVLAALAAAHRAGLVHRDVKPENILLADDGAVKVADFGLARAIESDASNTRTGLMMGTVAYCPPEQISRGQADARSDVYSAGVVLFELLTGSTPYVGDSAMAVAYQHVNSDVPAPSSRRESVPPQLDDVVLRATSRDPGGRQLDSGAFLAELHDVRVDLGLPVVGVPARSGSAARSANPSRSTAQARPADTTHPAESARPAPSTPPRDGRGRPSDAITAPTQAVGYGPQLHQTAIHESFVSPAQPSSAPSRPGGPQRPSPYRSPERRSKARRRALIATIIVLVISVATAYAGWWLVAGRYHALPSVAGQSQQAATQSLRDDGFLVGNSVTLQYSETVPAGRVITTDPKPGSRLLAGASIKLVVSRGPERFKVPDVSGTYDQVEQTLKDIPVRVVRSDAADPTGKILPGQLIKISPPPGSSVKRGDVVTVYISTGPPIVDVPDVRGKTLEQATKILEHEKFQITTTEQFSDTVEKGSVISQSPDPSNQAVKFSTVALVVSKGPSATVPDIPEGSDPEEAKAQLEELGFKVDVQKKQKAIFDFSGYVVDRTDPPAGTVLEKGATVTLYVK